MRKITVFALSLLAAAFAAIPARAVDQRLFAAVAAEIPIPQPKQYDERAVLAALLARPDAAAEFEADGKAAMDDPALKTLFIAKWRGRAAKYAAVSVSIGAPDAGRTYQNWKEVLGPEGYAYIRLRLQSMEKADVDSLVGYLGMLDQKLKENNFKLDYGMFSISGKIVNGILAEYRKDLGMYLDAPATRRFQAGTDAAAAQLASGIQAKGAVAAVPDPAHAVPPRPTRTDPDPAAARPVRKPVKKPDEVVVAPRVVPPAADAEEQLRRAQRAGETAGEVFDGGLTGRTGSVVVAPNEGGVRTPPRLDPVTPRGGPVTAEVPSPVDDLDARVAQAAQSGVKPYSGKLGVYASVGGAVLGGLIGFLLGGFVGLAIGAVVLGAAGYFVSKRF